MTARFFHGRAYISQDGLVSCCAFYLARDSILNSIVMNMEQKAICTSIKSPTSSYTHRGCCLLQYHGRLASIKSFRLVYVVRDITERFLAPGSSDSQLYLVLAELVTSPAVTPFFSTSKSAATSGQTVSKELHSQTFWPAQQGHPVCFLPKFREKARACQLCTLPLGHS